ncbi:hypothetical protein [Phytoactinopolyspora limicola]|nr:hypothetical protein [Phytoactinopolyspora limicola]
MTDYIVRGQLPEPGAPEGIDGRITVGSDPKNVLVDIDGVAVKPS